MTLGGRSGIPLTSPTMACEPRPSSGYGLGAEIQVPYDAKVPYWQEAKALKKVGIRLSLFDDEPDINGGSKVALGAAMITMGLHQFVQSNWPFRGGCNAVARGRSCRLWVHL